MSNLGRTSLLLLALSSSPALAEVTFHETVVHDTTTTVDVKLDASTVLCSSADYGALFLKVLIPELAPITLLDHQNTGAGAPCVAAGPCQPGNMPEDIIDTQYPSSQAAINVKAIRIDQADSTAQTCTTTLREDVAVTIRGVPFTHTRYASLGERPFSDCGKALPAQPEPTPEAKTDTVEETKPETGGCSTGSASGAWLLALGLGAVVARRRRR